jgi:hypothetical protein
VIVRCTQIYIDTAGGAFAITVAGTTQALIERRLAALTQHPVDSGLLCESPTGDPLHVTAVAFQKALALQEVEMQVTDARIQIPGKLN